MRRRSFLKNLLAVLAGLGLVVVLETVLQLLDLGPPNQLFLESHQGGEVIYVVNQQVGHRFFQHQYLRSVPSNSSFPRQKSPDTVRIFVLGASTLLGFPNPEYTSFPHFLEGMLADAYEGKRFEVINCGMTAINTFCLLDFMREIVAYDPDLVLIYAGHNEFIGPYGVTTPFLRFGNERNWIRLYMQLQRTRVYYYLKEALYRLQNWRTVADVEEGFGLHLASKEIGLLDEAYRITVENYRANLEEMLAVAHRHQVPVLLSTLVSNLKDFYPLRSNCDDSELSRELAILVRQGRLQRAVQVCEERLNEMPYCGNIRFELGRLYYRQGVYRRAHQYFVYARDMDRLPFRAPTIFNQVVRNLAGAAQGPLLFSDTEKVFSRASPHGIIGNELITEYLHPTVYGHYLIALNMVKELTQSPVGRGWGRGDIGKMKDYEDYSRQLGYSLMDRISHRNDLMLFLRKMPYRNPPVVLRQHVAALLHEQLRHIPRLKTEERRHFTERGGMVFLSRMLDFLLPEDREVLKSEFERLELKAR